MAINCFTSWQQQPPICCHSLPLYYCALCNSNKPDTDDLLRRIERLEKIVEHICPDKLSDV